MITVKLVVYGDTFSVKVLETNIRLKGRLLISTEDISQYHGHLATIYGSDGEAYKNSFCFIVTSKKTGRSYIQYVDEVGLDDWYMSEVREVSEYLKSGCERVEDAINLAKL